MSCQATLPSNEQSIELVRLLIASAYTNYSLCTNYLLCSGRPALHQQFECFSSPRPGDLVMEISSISMRQHDECRIGYLVSDAMEPYGTDEWWEENKDEYDSQRPTERAYRIKRLIGGEEFRWTNAKMVRVVTNAIGELP